MDVATLWLSQSVASDKVMTPMPPFAWDVIRCSLKARLATLSSSVSPAGRRKNPSPPSNRDAHLIAASNSASARNPSPSQSNRRKKMRSRVTSRSEQSMSSPPATSTVAAFT